MWCLATVWVELEHHGCFPLLFLHSHTFFFGSHGPFPWVVALHNKPPSTWGLHGLQFLQEPLYRLYFPSEIPICSTVILSMGCKKIPFPMVSLWAEGEYWLRNLGHHIPALLLSPCCLYSAAPHTAPLTVPLPCGVCPPFPRMPPR